MRIFNVVCNSILMKALLAIVIFIMLASCGSHKAVTMPFRNYELSAERLMPLSYSDAKQSIRIWVSRSTSIDTVFTVSQNVDSSFSAFSIELGQKYKATRKATAYFSQSKVQPSSGFPGFFQSLDSLNVFTYNDQKDLEIVLHEPISICIVEYIQDKRYTKFSFCWDCASFEARHEKYKRIEDFVKREFKIGVSPK